MNNVQTKIDSPIGDLYLVASSKGLRGMYWKKQSARLVNKPQGAAPEEKVLAAALKQLTEYFNGRRKDFDLPLDLEGTSFQKKVWQQLQKIPFGQTVSYGEVAKRIKNPKAVRAVGSANGKNPVCVIVPCHRVIASDGTIGGYSGGLQVKRKLLALEGIKRF